MNKYPFRVASIHDLHLGHNKTKAHDVADRLLNQLTDTYFMTLDLLLIPGDFIDQNLLYSDPTTITIADTMVNLLKLASQYDVSIKIVKGTPSHDGDQLEHFIKLAEYLDIPVKISYYKDMAIEFDEDLGISVLYVPDEWASREDMYIEAIRLLSENNLEQVDFIVGHNQFGYQFREGLRDKISHLKEEDWCKLVKYHAFFGHVHIQSQYDKILVAGSYDRLKHGEEQPKGFYEVTYYEDGYNEIKFIENAEAELYKSLYLLPDYDSGNTAHFNWLLDRMKELERPNGHVRIMYHDKGLPIKDLLAILKQHYPSYLYTAHFIGDEETQVTTILPDEEIEDYISLTPDNLPRLIEEQLQEHPQRHHVLALTNHYIKEST